jgi:flavin reductase (DIM6/NTAB) family NADH-FMN oxidoreductase RutF
MDMIIQPAGLSPRDRFNLLSSIVTPRPIAFVSTRSLAGADNLAPFSFFTVATAHPATVLFSIGLRGTEKKDTLRNIEEHPQFAFNLAGEAIARQMNNCATDFKPGVSEFEQVGLTPVPAEKIDCSVVAEALVHLECELDEIIPKGSNFLILGSVVCITASDSMLKQGQIDTDVYLPLGRLGDEKYGSVRETFQLAKDQFPPELQLPSRY